MINNQYKKWHKPRRDEGKKKQPLQGYFKPSNKEKYIGELADIIYRSSWELSFMQWCDRSPSVLRWSSEPISVPYLDPVSNLNECKRLNLNPNSPINWKKRNYHVDFWVEVDKGDSITEKWFIEIKPADKLIKPTPPVSNAPLKEVRRFNLAAKEFLINEAKWKSMNEFAKKNNVKFFIFTEKTLQKICGKFFNS